MPASNAEITLHAGNTSTYFNEENSSTTKRSHRNRGIYGSSCTAYTVLFHSYCMTSSLSATTVEGYSKTKQKGKKQTNHNLFSPLLLSFSESYRHHLLFARKELLIISTQRGNNAIRSRYVKLKFKLPSDNGIGNSVNRYAQFKNLRRRPSRRPINIELNVTVVRIKTRF